MNFQDTIPKADGYYWANIRNNGWQGWQVVKVQNMEMADHSYIWCVFSCGWEDRLVFGDGFEGCEWGERLNSPIEAGRAQKALLGQ